MIVDERAARVFYLHAAVGAGHIELAGDEGPLGLAIVERLARQQQPHRGVVDFPKATADASVVGLQQVLVHPYLADAHIAVEGDDEFGFHGRLGFSRKTYDTRSRSWA